MDTCNCHKTKYLLLPLIWELYHTILPVFLPKINVFVLCTTNVQRSNTSKSAVFGIVKKVSFYNIARCEIWLLSNQNERMYFFGVNFLGDFQTMCDDWLPYSRSEVWSRMHAELELSFWILMTIDFWWLLFVWRRLNEEEAFVVLLLLIFLTFVVQVEHEISCVWVSMGLCCRDGSFECIVVRKDLLQCDNQGEEWIIWPSPPINRSNRSGSTRKRLRMMAKNG